MPAGARLWAAPALVVAFVALAIAAHGPSGLPLDLRLARWIQDLDWPLLTPLTDIANWSMRTAPLAIGVLLALTFLWARGHRTEATVLLAAGLLTPLSYPLKDTIASPRPTPELIQVIDYAGGYGFPGGRSGNAVLVAGALAWIAARRIESRVGRIAVWTAAAVWSLIVGVARVRVGDHWPSDILGSWLWTAPALLFIVSIAESQSRRPPRYPAGMKSMPDEGRKS